MGLSNSRVSDSSIEAPPSVLPQRHYCDITGLEAPYTDPATGLRYHDKSVYALIQGLVSQPIPCPCLPHPF
ncbi:hypothetical protein FA13DRAFT_1745325, partial [Coprinellus micaceus]